MRHEDVDPDPDRGQKGAPTIPTLYLTPTADDRRRAEELLEGQDIRWQPFQSMRSLCNEWSSHGGMRGVTICDQRDLGEGAIEILLERLRGEPSWSTPPVILLIHRDDLDEQTVSELSELCTLTLLEHPLVGGLISTAVRSAVKVRSGQSEHRDLRQSFRDWKNEREMDLTRVSGAFRNSLAAISTSTELLRRECECSAVGQEQLGRLDRQIQAMSEQLQTMLGEQPSSTIPGSSSFPAPPPPMPPPPDDGEVRGKLRVLVVEDHDDVRNALGELLEITGFHPELAADGLQGIEHGIAVAPDVALVDIDLPGADGYEVARALRKGLGDKIRLFAMTGHGSSEARDKALAAGFESHLVKPVAPNTLIDLLESIAAEK